MNKPGIYPSFRVLAREIIAHVLLITPTAIAIYLLIARPLG